MDTITLILHGADWECPCVQRFKESMEKYVQKIVTGWERKEEGKERRERERRKCICIILHVPIMLANIDNKIPLFINIKSSIFKKSLNHTENLEVDIVQ